MMSIGVKSIFGNVLFQSIDSNEQYRTTRKIEDFMKIPWLSAFSPPR